MNDLVKTIDGLHHVMAVVPSAKRTLEFYSGVLGLVLLCRTVDIDDPSVLQLYFGRDHDVMMSFLIKGRVPVSSGKAGELSSIVFGVPEGSLSWWEKRLRREGIVSFGRAWAFAEEYLCFLDPDGLGLALVEERLTGQLRPGLLAPVQTAITRIRSIELQTGGESTIFKNFLGILGFEEIGRDGALTRFLDGPPERPLAVDLLSTLARETVQEEKGFHQRVAWRVHDVEALKLQATRLAGSGHEVSPIKDRQFFQAADFSGPFGLQCAIATEQPGLDSLAVRPPRLSLPDWLEGRRVELEKLFDA